MSKVTGTVQTNKHLSSLNTKRQHRKRWKVEGKTALTLRKSAEPLMRYLLQIVISQLVKNHPQKVPFMLVNESSERFFVQDKEYVKKKYRQPNSKMSACGSLCRSRTGTRLSSEGHLIERKERLQKTTEKERGNREKWKSREEPKGREGVAEGDTYMVTERWKGRKRRREAARKKMRRKE